MKKMECFKRVTACALVLLLAVPFTAIAQQIEVTADAQSPEQTFRPEELDQMLAPVALYPDALLAQTLTAATYPLDIVAADRFVKANPGLKSDELMAAAKDMDWSPSVKAMLQFPDVLAMMDNQLDWTTKLGDAFLAQQREVMDSVQRLRQRAYAQGKLNTNKEEMVKQDPQTQTIIIEEANPEVVYVPVYDPLDVYGTWWYPDYPPYYCYYPGYIVGGFLVGVFAGSIWGWGSWDCDWHRHGVFVDVNNFNNFTSHSFSSGERFHISRNAGGKVAWEHNPQFRRNAGYRDYWTAQRFGGQKVSNPAVMPSTPAFRGAQQAVPSAPASRGGQQAAPSTPVFRGREQAGTKVSAPRGGTDNTKVVIPSTPRPEFRGNIGNQQATQPQPAITVSSPSPRGQVSVAPPAREFTRSSESSSVFNGAGSGGFERAASFRGNSSFQSARTSSGSSGVSHGGGESGREGGQGGDRQDNRRR